MKALTRCYQTHWWLTHMRLMLRRCDLIGHLLGSPMRRTLNLEGEIGCGDREVCHNLRETEGAVVDREGGGPQAGLTAKELPLQMAQ